MYYTIVVGHYDGITFTEEIANCYGQEIEIIDDHSCNVLISDLIKAPFHHQWGASIYAKVTATNIIGDSVISLKGNDAIILTYPDLPTDLTNVPEITARTQVGLTWIEGSANGGSVVIDYKITYGEETGSYN